MKWPASLGFTCSTNCYCICHAPLCESCENPIKRVTHLMHVENWKSRERLLVWDTLVHAPSNNAFWLPIAYIVVCLLAVGHTSSISRAFFFSLFSWILECKQCSRLWLCVCVYVCWEQSKGRQIGLWKIIWHNDKLIDRFIIHLRKTGEGTFKFVCK